MVRECNCAHALAHATVYLGPDPCFWVDDASHLLYDRSQPIDQFCFSFQRRRSLDVSGSDYVTVVPKALRLSLNDALGLFLSQNLDVLMAKYGIEYRKGQEVTARLFPNPVLSVGTQGSNTQGRTLSNSGQLFTQASQLFELAGKRGYRIESAEFGTQSAEAAFEDAVRQLGFTVKDTFAGAARCCHG